ncbi:MAG: hypothetical protein V4735_02120 [Pseudomonadota bacterium]
MAIIPVGRRALILFLCILSMASPAVANPQGSQETNLFNNFKIAGAYPGMAVSEAKKMGFNACSEAVSSSEIRCSKVKDNGSVFGLKIKEVQLVINPPYHNVDSVEVMLETVSHEKRCAPKRGTDSWDDEYIYPEGCTYILRDVVERYLGSPMGRSAKRNYWHNCGLDNLAIKPSSFDTVVLSKEPETWLPQRKYECEERDKVIADKAKSKATKGDFIKQMQQP